MGQGRRRPCKTVWGAHTRPGGDPAAGPPLTRAQLVKWVREQVASGHEVHTVYEACGFGYPLHEALVAAGAKSLVTTQLYTHVMQRPGLGVRSPLDLVG